MADDLTNGSSPVVTTGTGVAPVSNLIIPDDIIKQYPELIEMIKASRSMNDEERQYWVDALAIMSEDQVKNLYGILDNERKQIQAAENNSRKSGSLVKKRSVEFDSEAYREKKQSRLEAEHKAEAEETFEEEGLLAQLAAL